jgi:hypothetical protein
VESDEEDAEEIMQYMNLDNMLSTVVPQLLSVSGKYALEVHGSMDLIPRHF